MQNWMASEIKANMGLNLMETGHYGDAIKYYTQQIEHDPNNDELYFWRGRAYREAAAVMKRHNNHQNNEKVIDYFQKSSGDYLKAAELGGLDVNLLQVKSE